MYRFALLALILSLSLAVPDVSAQTPQINDGGVVNAASFAQPGVLAPGVMFSLFGTSLTDGTTEPALTLPLPTRLAGASVLVNGVAAPLFFVSPLQINAQFPVELAGLTSASIQVEVQTDSGTIISPAITVPVEPFSPGIYTLNASGSGPGAILRASDFSFICPQGTANCSANSALRGEAITIFMTGLGQVQGPWSSGEPAEGASPTLTTPELTIGGITAEVLYSGLAPGYVALYQVNVRVPSDAPTGNDVPLSLSIGGSTSNEVTIAIEPGPLGGGIHSVAVDLKNGNIVYAATINDISLLSG